jgi:hypothetical protein
MTAINKKQLILISLFLTVLGTGITIFSSRQQYSVTVIRCNQGWGYNILKGRSIIIHQPYIPCFEGNFTFEDKNTAQRTGNLVVEKIRHNQSPRISINELTPILKAKHE